MKSWDTLAHYVYICNIPRFHFNNLLTIEICLLSFIEILFSELHNKQTVYITIKQIVLVSQFYVFVLNEKSFACYKN